MDITQLTNKLNDFHTALQDITDAIRNKDVALDGGGLLSLNNVAEKIDSIQTQRDMGTQEVTFEQNAIIFGIEVTKNEADPKMRVKATDDLVGHVRMEIDQEADSIKFGTLKSSFLYKALDHIVLKSQDLSEEIELKPNDYSKKLDGSAAPEAGEESIYNTFARADKVYTYMNSDDEKEYYYISNRKVDDNYQPLGFINENGEEVDSSYLGTYIGMARNYKNKYCLGSFATSGHHPYGGNISSIVSMADANASNKGYLTITYAQSLLYFISFLMFFQDFKSTHTCEAFIQTSSGSFPTGSLSDKGSIAISSKANYPKFKFMHIEDFFVGNGSPAVLGCMFQNGNMYTRMKPPYPLDSLTTYDSSTLSMTFNTMGVYVKSFNADNIHGKVIENTLIGQNYYEEFACTSARIPNDSKLKIGTIRNGRVNNTNEVIFSSSSSAVNTSSRLSLIPSN